MRWVVLMVALSGCFTELLGSPALTTRNVACAALHEELAEELTLVLHVDADATMDLTPAAEHFFQEFGNITGRHPSDFRMAIRPFSTMDIGLLPAEVFDGGDLVVHVLQTPGVEVVEWIRPGVMQINDAAFAGNLTLATGALMHGLGHMFGVVNAGIPMNNTDPTHELPGNHERGGVMAPGWHDLERMPTTGSIRYSDAVRQDWQLSKEVCL